MTLSMPMHRDLERISKETGGKSYAVYSRADLLNIYELIALDIQTKIFCHLYWEAPYGCDEASLYRDVDITFIPQEKTINRPYNAPESSIAIIEKSDDIISFGNPDVFEEKEITFSPQNTPLTIDTMYTQPDTYFSVENPDVLEGESLPYTIQPGESKTVKVRFNQQAPKQFRQSLFVAEGDPCPVNVTLVGGYSTIQIINPVGGEIFSTCDSIDIQWAGVDEEMEVNLYYSTDDGATWNLIQPINLTGLHHKWLPPVGSDKYKIYASVAPDATYMWANSEGGAEDVIATSLAVQNDGLYHYICGYYEGEAQFGTETITSTGQQDIFVAKYNTDGQFIWVKSFGGPGVDSASGITLDDENNVYITGSCQKDARFDNIVPTMSESGKTYIFISKIPSTGSSALVKVIGAQEPTCTFNGWGQEIRYDSKAEKIFIRGEYTGEIIINGGVLYNSVNPEIFTAQYEKNLTLYYLQQKGQDYDDYSSKQAYDQYGYLYETGSFANQLKLGSHTLTSNGNKDAFISKYGGVPGSMDTCEVFTVAAPLLEFTKDPLDFGLCTVNQTEPKIFSAVFCNSGSIPVTVESVVFNGNNPDEFKLVSNIESLTVPPDSCLSLELNFSPAKIGDRSAMMYINVDCGDPVSVRLTGEGQCGGIAQTPIYMGKLLPNYTRDSTVTCAFENTNNSSITIKPELEGPNAGEFEIKPTGTILVPAGECFEVKITFKPTFVGDKTAYINYHTPDGCENPMSELFGHCIQNIIEPVDLNFGERKKLSTNKETMTITNDGAQESIITNIDLADKSNSIFTIDPASLPTFPYTIKPGEPLNIDIIFVPEDETDYQNTVQFFIQGESDPATGIVAGTGIMPKIFAYVDCSTPDIAGKTVDAELVIENPSSSSVLFVSNVELVNKTNNEYAWKTGVTLSNITVAKNGETRLGMDFTPSAPGVSSEDIQITSDAIEGDTESFDTLITTPCEAIGLSGDTKNMGNVLICNNFTDAVEITNNADNTSLTINGYYFMSADSIAFEVFLDEDLVIAPLSSGSLDIKFSPEEIREYNTSVVFTTTEGANLEIELIGYGKNINLFVPNEYKNQKGSPAGSFKELPVFANIDELSHEFIESFGVKVYFFDDMCTYKEATFVGKTLDNNWSWGDFTKVDGENSYEVYGSGEMITPVVSKELFRIKYDIYLSDVQETQIRLQPILEPCSTPDTLGANIKLDEVCYQEGSLVDFSNLGYYIETPRPNPASNVIEFDFSVAFDDYTRIEIINNMGNVVSIPVDKVFKAGVYTVTVDAKDIPSGVYYLRMAAGHVVKTQRLLISK